MVTRKVSEPVQDAVKAYLELAFGLTEASRKKAEKAVKKVAKELVGKGGATAVQLQSMVDELLATGNANREAVTRLVRIEMDRALSRVGLATIDEVATLTDRVDALERELREAKARPATAAATVAKPVTVAKPGTVAKSATGAKPATGARSATGAKSTAAVKKAPAAKTVPGGPSTPVAKKAVAKKAVKKAAP